MHKNLFVRCTLWNVFAAPEPPGDKVKRCDHGTGECEHVCEDTPSGIKCSCFDGFRAKGSSCIGNPYAHSHVQIHRCIFHNFISFEESQTRTPPLPPPIHPLTPLSVSRSRHAIFPLIFPPQNSPTVFVLTTYSHRFVVLAVFDVSLRHVRVFPSPPRFIFAILWNSKNTSE